MDTEFIDDDFFEAKRLEEEKKKQKKREKQERLEKRKIAIQEFQKNLENQQEASQMDEFKFCFQAASQFKQGTKEWALMFLNLAPNAKLTEIRKKYIKLAQNWHPDKKNVTSHEAMKYLNEAWQVLKKKL